MEAIQAELMSFVAVVIASLLGVLTQKVTAYLKGKGLAFQNENNKALAKIVVQAIEQTYKQLNGDEKLNVAKAELIKLTNEKGMKISEQEIDLLIESSVKEMKEAFQKEAFQKKTKQSNK